MKKFDFPFFNDCYLNVSTPPFRKYLKHKNVYVLSSLSSKGLKNKKKILSFL